MDQENKLSEIRKIEGALEAILFAAGHPVSYDKIGEALELIKMKRLLLIEELDEFGNPRGISTRLKANPEFGTELPDDLEIDGYNE